MNQIKQLAWFLYIAFFAFIMNTQSLQGTWDTLVPLTAVQVGAAIGNTVIDAHGNSIAVFTNKQGLDTNIRIYSSTHAPAGTWTTSIPVSLDGEDASTPFIAMNKSGNAVAVWRQQNGLTGEIWSSTLVLGNSWSTPVMISTAGFESSNPFVGIDNGGNALAVWQQSDGVNIRTAASYRSYAGSWMVPVFLSAAGQDAINPQISVNSYGRALAVWQRNDGTNQIVQASYYSGSWSSPTNLSLSGQNALSPVVGLDNNGNGVAAWMRSDGTNVQIQSATFRSGTWNSPVFISSLPFDVNSIALGVGANGNSVAIWSYFDGSFYRVAYASLPNGGTWTQPTQFIPTGYSLAIAVDSSGNALIGYIGNSTPPVISMAIPFLSTPIALSPITTDTSTLYDRLAVALNDMGYASALLDVEGGETLSIIEATNEFQPFPREEEETTSSSSDSSSSDSSSDEKHHHHHHHDEHSHSHHDEHSHHHHKKSSAKELF